MLLARESVVDSASRRNHTFSITPPADIIIRADNSLDMEDLMSDSITDALSRVGETDINFNEAVYSLGLIYTVRGQRRFMSTGFFGSPHDMIDKVVANFGRIEESEEVWVLVSMELMVSEDRRVSIPHQRLRGFGSKRKRTREQDRIQIDYKSGTIHDLFFCFSSQDGQ